MTTDHEEDYIDPNFCAHDRLVAQHAYGIGRKAVFDWRCKECGHFFERSGWEGEE